MWARFRLRLGASAVSLLCYAKVAGRDKAVFSTRAPRWELSSSTRILAHSWHVLCHTYSLKRDLHEFRWWAEGEKQRALRNVVVGGMSVLTMVRFHTILNQIFWLIVEIGICII